MRRDKVLALPYVPFWGQPKVDRVALGSSFVSITRKYRSDPLLSGGYVKASYPREQVNRCELRFWCFPTAVR